MSLLTIKISLTQVLLQETDIIDINVDSSALQDLLSFCKLFSKQCSSSSIHYLFSLSGQVEALSSLTSKTRLPLDGTPSKIPSRAG